MKNCEGQNTKTWLTQCSTWTTAHCRREKKDVLLAKLKVI